MQPLSNFIWLLGLALQLLLLELLFRRGLARRFPVMTGLIVFYILRSALLAVMGYHIARDTYEAWADAFSMADVALETLLAAEIAAKALRGRGAWTGGRIAGTVAIAVVVAAAAATAAAYLPSRGTIPIDRGSAFASLLLVLVFLWAVALRTRGPALRIAAGFAVYSAVAVGAAVERNQAALHRNAAAYVAGSYTQSGVYLAVVVFWILALKSAETPQARLAPA
jgi:hypothetical protein